MLSYTYKQLCRAAKHYKPGKDARSIVIIGDCATQHLATALRGMAALNRLEIIVTDTDYNQVDAQILDKGSELYDAKPDEVIICLCVEKLYGEFCHTPPDMRAGFAKSYADRLRGLRKVLASNCGARIIQFTFADMDDGVFGSFSQKVEASFPVQLSRLNSMLKDDALVETNLLIFDVNTIQNEIGRKNFHDDKLYYIAKLPFSHEAMAYIVQGIGGILNAAEGRIKKCIVLDLDNTLWGGIIGDDGIGGIEIGEIGLGQAFTEFQLWLKELSRRGILLAVCSKNDEDNAKEPFLKHPDMVLRLEDFAVFVANWGDKASNIRYIQSILNIGMDSIVFIDDNPFERDAVQSLIPEITVPEMPEDPAEYVSFLRGLNLFETLSYSAGDSERTEQYRQKVKSIELQAAYGSYDDYLESLCMEASVSGFKPFSFPRIAQLTQRSNQFNFRTGRYSESDIERLENEDEVITLQFELKDKHTDHGLISLVIMDKCPDGKLFIREWLMSCRVLKRGMEEFVADTIVRTAAKNGFERIEGEYLKTAKNAMVSQLPSKLGFVQNGDKFYTNIDEWINHKTFITENVT